MRNRQMFADLGDGVFGFSYTSQSLQKLGLVGTLARYSTLNYISESYLALSIVLLE
jgi:hypothetical protein